MKKSIIGLFFVSVMLFTSCGIDTVEIVSENISKEEVLTKDTADTTDTADTVDTADKASSVIFDVNSQKDNTEESSKPMSEVIKELPQEETVSSLPPMQETVFDEEPEFIEAAESDDTNFENWIWVGDSRFYFMSNEFGLYYLAKSGEGYDWFTTVADALYDLEGYNIILNFGVNDTWNVLNYADFYNNMPDSVFEKNKVYFVSVNPVDESFGYYGFNSVVQWFNENIRVNLREDIGYIDTYSYLFNEGFTTIDGIHYDYNTDVMIYNYILESVRREL